jgi:hypothetical protein
MGIIQLANYRRCYVPSGSCFFTVVTERRALILGNDLARNLFGRRREGTVRRCRVKSNIPTFSDNRRIKAQRKARDQT